MDDEAILHKAALLAAEAGFHQAEEGMARLPAGSCIVPRSRNTSSF